MKMFLLLVLFFGFITAGCISEEKITPEEKKCLDAGGQWRGGPENQFPNTCADICYPPLASGEQRVCGQALTDACDCGPDKCWNKTSEECTPDT